MAAILLVNSSEVDELAIDKARRKFQKKSFDLKEEKFLLGDYQLYFYHDLFGNSDKIYQNEKSDVFLMVGTLVFERKTGTAALKAIEKRLDRGSKLEDMVFLGSYILIIYKDGELKITRDLFGGIGCYTALTNNWFTTNFLAAVVLHGSNRFSKNELLESILFGFSFGYHTVVEGVYLMDSTKLFNLSLDTKIDKPIKIPPIETNLKRCLQNNLDILIEEFEQYAEAFDGKLVSALSGGFDSRLILALTGEVGVTPQPICLWVGYGSRCNCC